MEKGKHVIIDFHGIPPVLFETLLSKQYEEFHTSIQAIIRKNGMTLLGYTYNDFLQPQGAFTSLYLLSESHISFHTWPEDNYIAVDVFTCGSCNIDQLVLDIQNILQPQVTHKIKIQRGNPTGLRDDDKI